MAWAGTVAPTGRPVRRQTDRFVEHAMRLTTFSDYMLRTLMYLALHSGRFVTIAEIAGAWGISPNHLTKVVQHLGARGDVTTLRGPHGGVRLGRPAREIRLGEVIRQGEPGMILAPETDPTVTRLIKPAGPWADVLGKAVAAFMAVLDEHTLADLVADPGALRPLLQRQDASAEALAAEASSDSAGRFGSA